uniref:GRF-type domain-containing protein n=1 Tax=Brassica oleracea var. oleracea TaxID=109376 RepID=A0A0D3D2R8_BRAOL
MSDSSSSATGGGIRVRTPGIPIKCWCGEHMTELISKSNQNSYRWYYRCRYAAQRKLENDNHIFKWVDEAFTDEIRQLDYQVRMLEEEVQVLKATIRSEGPKIISGGRLILGLSVVVVVGFGFFDVQVIPKAITKLNFLFFLSLSYVSPKLCKVERL